MSKDAGRGRCATLPPGYSLETEGSGCLVLRRADGSAVAVYAFSAFGPTPESIRLAAEEDRRALRGGEEGTGGEG